MIAHLIANMGSGPGALLVLLLAGHVLGDFLFQTEWMARQKEEHPGPLFLHAAVMLGVHTAVLSPFLTADIWIGLVCLAVVHLILDALRSRALGDWGRTLAAFFVDQALHVVAVLVLWGVVGSASGFETVRWLPSTEWVAWSARWMGVVSGYVFAGGGAERIVRGVLERFEETVKEPGLTEAGGSGAQGGRADEMERKHPTGRLIGYLERFLTLTLILGGQWAALGLILAAKSIARFPELKDKPFAEYYLLGTLTSILVAVAIGIPLRLLLQ